MREKRIGAVTAWNREMMMATTWIPSRERLVRSSVRLSLYHIFTNSLPL
jgi:hypothetical protein